MRLAGIDEAGYGPLLGPLAIVGVCAEAADERALASGFAAAATGARDSKAVHTPGDIAALEAVALPAISWLAGRSPATAAECFALLGEGADIHARSPWMGDAAALALPVSRAPMARWSIPGVDPIALAGRLVQPAEYNAAQRAGINKAALELEVVGRHLQALLPASATGLAIVDRLGGRRYYAEALQAVWPEAMVLIERERREESRYIAVHGGGETTVAFCVGGEARSPLTAVASCIAKYARELHMLLLNRHWGALLPALAPTAGYPLDARRWLAAVGPERIHRLEDLLIRCGPPEPEPEPLAEVEARRSGR